MRFRDVAIVEMANSAWRRVRKAAPTRLALSTMMTGDRCRRRDAVKIEGGGRSVPAMRALVDAGIPVMGHLGLTPQSILAFGGYKVQGRGGAAAEMLLADAKAIESAGCFAMVLESIPAGLAAKITAAVGVPTIGIGAGVDCDGQVLVLHDMLGLYEEFQPKFVKRYAALAVAIEAAVNEYKSDVVNRRFPGPEHSFGEARTLAGKEPAPSGKKAASRRRRK